MQYLLSVLHTFQAYFVIGLVLFIASMLVQHWNKVVLYGTGRPAKKAAEDEYKWDDDKPMPKDRLFFTHVLRACAAVVLAFGLAASLLSPQNTPKREAAHDTRAAQQALIKAAEANAPQGVTQLEDKARKPELTKEERDKRFQELTDYSKK